MTSATSRFDNWCRIFAPVSMFGTYESEVYEPGTETLEPQVERMAM